MVAKYHGQGAARHARIQAPQWPEEQSGDALAAAMAAAPFRSVLAPRWAAQETLPPIGAAAIIEPGGPRVCGPDLVLIADQAEAALEAGLAFAIMAHDQGLRDDLKQRLAALLQAREVARSSMARGRA